VSRKSKHFLVNKWCTRIFKVIFWKSWASFQRNIFIVRRRTAALQKATMIGAQYKQYKSPNIINERSSADENTENLVLY